MREYGKVHSSFWSSKTVGELSEDGRTPRPVPAHQPAQQYRWRLQVAGRRATEDLKWGSERVAKGFAELFRKGFANRCETTKWVYIGKHFEGIRSRTRTSARQLQKIALTIPDECAWKLDFMRVWGEPLGIDSSNSRTLPKPFETVP